MIELFAWPTPNAHKISIMLEECALAYRVVEVDINAGDQFIPLFLAISPNNRIPALIDSDGPAGKLIALFESGAILIYLADKAGRFLPTAPHARMAALQWLFFQMGGLGPMCGQAHHFRQMAAEQIPYAVARYTNEVGRLYGVMDRRLGEEPYLAGDEYTIADIASWPWVRLHRRQGQAFEDFPNVERWFKAIGARAAVARGMQLLAHRRGNRVLTDSAREILFGATQFQRR